MSLIGHLQAGRGYNVEALAHECGVSRRTIFRDLDILRLAGVPLAFDPENQCYRIPGSYYLPPTNFTPEEALSLIVLCHELGDRSRLPFFAPARSAAAKLESSLPKRLLEQLQRVRGAVHIDTGPHSPLEGQDPTYQRLLDAVGSRQCVRIRYQSHVEGVEICTRLSPYRLLFSRRSWYVIGRASLYRSVRTFNVSRIFQIELLDDRYQIPASFSIDRYLGNAWHLIPEPGPDREVFVRFSPLVARNVAEVGWHKTQRTSFTADGSLDFRVTVSGLHEMSWWILGYGDQAEVIEPPELRRMLAERVNRLAARYNEGSC